MVGSPVNSIDKESDQLHLVNRVNPGVSAGKGAKVIKGARVKVQAVLRKFSNKPADRIVFDAILREGSVT